MGYEVGRIIEVRGLSVKAKLNTLLPPYLVNNGNRENAPKINGFVKTKVGLETIICQVIGEYNEEKAQQPIDYFIELQVRGNITNGKFVQGLRMLPIVSSKIETLDDEDYKTIYSNNENGIVVGYDLFDEKKNISISINKLIPSHIGVFGNTGSGKSNTLTKIFFEYTNSLHKEKTNRGKCIIFDLNNEYSNDAICKVSDKTIYTLYTRKDSPKKIPLNLEELKEDEFITFLNASEKTQIPVIKNAYKKTFDDSGVYNKEYYLRIIKPILKNNRKNLFQTIRYHLKEYITNIDDFKYHSRSDCFYYDDVLGPIYSNQAQQFDEKLNNISLKLPEKKIDRFLFDLYFSIAIENENGVQLDYMLPLVSRANKLFSDFKRIFSFDSKESSLFEGKNVCIVQLANTNKDMKEIVPAIISDHIFNKLSERKEQSGNIVQIVSIVIDEAHNILYEGDSARSHNAVLSTFEKIVKEGRKFGCFLAISSQRPSDISQTIISQMHNYFIHKLVNPGDINKIRNAVAYLDSKSLDFITVLAPGECIVSGTAFQMPTFIYVNQVPKKYRPNSENVKLTGKNSLFSMDSLNNTDDL